MTAHPLRPVVLALSLRLNYPEDLLAEIMALDMDHEGEHARLAAHAFRAGKAMAEAAVALERTKDAQAFAATEQFRRLMVDAGSALMGVATMPWPKEGEDREPEWQAARKLRKACLDIGAGCFALSSGRLPRPDYRNLLTNVTKAVPSSVEHVRWTFYTLPDYGGASPGTAEESRPAGAPGGAGLEH